MKKFFVTIGGREREVRFTSQHAIELKRRFGKPYRDLFYGEIFGAENGVLFVNSTDIEAQAAFLTLGLQAGGSKVSEAQVLKWIEEEWAKGRETWELLFPAAKAALYQGGVLGRSVDIEAQAEEEAPPAADGEAAGGEDGEGKAPPPGVVRAAE